MKHRQTGLALAALLAPLALAATGAAAHDPASARYLGNEGVLIARGETKILFDAFYSDGYSDYTLVPEAISNALLDDAPPYDGINAVFVSHAHGDHFSPAPLIAYLRANAGVQLFAPQQVEAALRANLGDGDGAILARIRAVALAPGAPPRRFVIDGLAVEAYAVPHTGGARTAGVENIAFRVTLDDATTVMHFGDADPADSHFVPYQADFAARTTDLALPPYWFLKDPEGRLVLERRIRPRHVIGVHVPARAAEDPEGWKREHGGDLFTTPGETRVIGEE